MTPDFIERIAIKIAFANNGGTWAEHYHETHKDVWRARAREIIADVLEEAAKIADAHEDDMGHGKGARIAAAIRERAKP